jgi:hypothetical protein
VHAQESPLMAVLLSASVLGLALADSGAGRLWQVYVFGWCLLLVFFSSGRLL